VRVHAAWVRHTARAVEEANSKRMFELGNYLRNGGLGHVETFCCFPHAADFNDRH
jgi:hypothetical protein